MEVQSPLPRDLVTVLPQGLTLKPDLEIGSIQIPTDWNIQCHLEIAKMHLEFNEVIQSFNAIKKGILKDEPVKELNDDCLDVFVEVCHKLLNHHVKFITKMKTIEICDMPTKDVAIKAGEHREIAIICAGHVISGILDKFIALHTSNEKALLYITIKAEFLFGVSKGLKDTEQRKYCSLALRHFNVAKELSKGVDDYSWELMYFWYHFLLFRYECLPDTKSHVHDSLKQHLDEYKGIKRTSKRFNAKGWVWLEKLREISSKWGKELKIER